MLNLAPKPCLRLMLPARLSRKGVHIRVTPGPGPRLSLREAHGVIGRPACQARITLDPQSWHDMAPAAQRAMPVAR